MSLILGFDIATRSGWALLEAGNSPKMKELGFIQLDNKHSRQMMYKAFRKAIIEVIELHKPSVVVLESVYHGKNVKTTAMLNQLRGLVLEAVPEDIEIISISPKTARKEILGSGAIAKPEVFKSLIKKHKIKDLKFTKNNDEIDALLLAEYGNKFAKTLTRD